MARRRVTSRVLTILFVEYSGRESATGICDLGTGENYDFNRQLSC